VGYIFVSTLCLSFGSLIMSPDPSRRHSNAESLLRSFYGIAFACAVVIGTQRVGYKLAKSFVFVTLSTSFLVMNLKYPSRKWARWYYAILFVGFSLLAMFVVGREAYRQDSYIWDMDRRTSIRFGAETVLLTDNYSEAFTALQNAALDNGMQADMPIIDMTGNSPGLVYVLNGRAYAYPWMAGDYEGSEELARMTLSYWSDDLIKEAWILSSDGPRELPKTLLIERGLNFPEDYEHVVTVYLEVYDGVNVSLWKPDDSD
jgi:hypothetical protein